MELTLLMQYNAVFAPVGDITSARNRAYCLRHGFSFGLSIGEPESGVHPVYGKIELLRSQLLTSRSDWFLWMDADAVILNQELDARAFLDEAFDLIISNDCNGLNSGVFFIRNSPWSRALIESVYALRRVMPNETMAEQNAMRALLSIPSMATHVKYAEQTDFNSYLQEKYGRPADSPGQYQPGHFILHLPGMNQQDRIDTLNSML